MQGLVARMKRCKEDCLMGETDMDKDMDMAEWIKWLVTYIIF